MTSIHNCTVACTIPRELADALEREAFRHNLKVSKVMPIALQHFILSGGCDAATILKAQILEKKVSGN